MPVLKEVLPDKTHNMKVKFFMQQDVKTIHSVASIKEIREILTETDHAAWPVLNIANNLCGIMPRSILHKLVTEKAWYSGKKKLEECPSPKLWFFSMLGKKDDMPNTETFIDIEA